MLKQEHEKINWLKNILTIVTFFLLAILYFSLKELKSSSSLVELVLSIIPDLLAALLAVLVVYYVFIRKGISDDNKLMTDLILNIKEKLKDEPFGNEEKVDNVLNLKERITDVKELQVLGHSCRYLFEWLETEIVEAVKNGMNLKIITIEPGSKAAQLMMETSYFKALEKDLKDLDLRLKKINEKISGSSKKVGQIEIRQMNWIPSCSLINLIPKRNEKGIVKLKIYSIYHGTPRLKIQTHKIIYENKEKELYEYFLNQFAELWRTNE